MRKIFLVFLFLLMPFSCLWSQVSEVALPKDAQESFRKELFIGPVKGWVVRYETFLSKEKITAFFKKEAPTTGWKQLRENYFVKEGYALSIVFLPSRGKNKRQQFMLTYANTPTKEELEDSKKEVPDRLNFMPVYPRAKQLFLWDTQEGMIASYQTADQIRQVVLFYKSVMPNSGWALYEETPIKESVAKKGCPDCEKNLMDDITKKFKGNPSMVGKFEQAIKAMRDQGVSLASSAMLAFRKNKQRCIINLMGYDVSKLPEEEQNKTGLEQKPAAADMSQFQGTQISVSYIENIP